MKRSIVFFFAVVGASAALPAAASETTDVARVSVIAQGNVVVQRGDDPTQLAARINTPLLPGDYVATQPGTLAEVQLDGLTMLRLGENAQIRIANNDFSTREVQLAQGSLILSIAHSDGSAAEIDTPSVTVHAWMVGDYRISVTPDGETLVTARSGRAEIVTPKQRYALVPGSSLSATGSEANPTINQTAEVARDALDTFDISRDRTVNAALDTDSYLPAAIAGYDDLNAYGNWIYVAPYGMVWNAHAPANWAPYRFGSWAWEDGFGWTWIALEPWGWAPFHYGYWFYCAPNGWCWYPPGVSVGPVWYPAVVGWFGFGNYWGATLGWEYWGWVPLGPFEPYYPWYPGWGAWHSHPSAPPRIAVHAPHLPNPIIPVRTNAVYGSNVTKAYRNMRYGATGVSGSAFRAGNFSKLVPVDAAHLKSMTVIRGALPLTPTAANVQFTHASSTAKVHWAQAFLGSRFTTSRGLPRRIQFQNQQQQVREALYAQSHAIVPAKPQRLPASEVWRQFENSRPNVTVPHVPPQRPASHPMPQPPRPSGGHPGSRTPAYLDWQTASQGLP